MLSGIPRSGQAAAMLNEDQKLLLSQLVLSNKSVLLGSLGPCVTNKTRAKMWQYVTDQLIANGAPTTTTANYMRHTEWGNLSRSVVEKFKTRVRSGAAGNGR